jgi:hypothetical protein
MPGVSPISPGAPGTVAPTAGYPQYGVGGGTPGSSAGWNVIVAHNELEKASDEANGYLQWFGTNAAAKAFISSESSEAGSGGNPLSGVDAIGDFFHRLTEKSTWTRVGEVAVGGILLYAGVRALSQGNAVAGAAKKAGSVATKPVRKVAKAGVTAAVPEARLAGRIAAKRVAPKATARVASHRAQVKQYGAKKPYSPPAQRAPTVRVSHVYHHKGIKP